MVFHDFLPHEHQDRVNCRIFSKILIQIAYHILNFSVKVVSMHGAVVRVVIAVVEDELNETETK